MMYGLSTENTSNHLDRAEVHLIFPATTSGAADLQSLSMANSFRQTNVIEQSMIQSIPAHVGFICLLILMVIWVMQRRSSIAVSDYERLAGSLRNPDLERISVRFSEVMAQSRN